MNFSDLLNPQEKTVPDKTACVIVLHRTCYPEQNFKNFEENPKFEYFHKLENQYLNDLSNTIL